MAELSITKSPKGTSQQKSPTAATSHPGTDPANEGTRERSIPSHPDEVATSHQANQIDNASGSSHSNRTEHSPSGINDPHTITHCTSNDTNIATSSGTSQRSPSGIYQAYDIHYPHRDQSDNASTMSTASNETAILSPKEKVDSHHPHGLATPPASQSHSTKDLASPPGKTAAASQTHPKRKRPASAPATPPSSDSYTSTNNNDDDEDEFVPLRRYPARQYKPTPGLSTPPPEPTPTRPPTAVERKLASLAATFARHNARTPAQRHTLLHDNIWSRRHPSLQPDMGVFCWLHAHREDIWASEEEARSGFTWMFADEYAESLWQGEVVELNSLSYEFWGRTDVSVEEAWGVLFGGEEGFGFDRAGGRGVEESVGPRGERI